MNVSVSLAPRSGVTVTMSLDEVVVLKKAIQECVELDDQEFGSLLGSDTRALLEQLVGRLP